MTMEGTSIKLSRDGKGNMAAMRMAEWDMGNRWFGE